jgi:hypothetical protein
MIYKKISKIWDQIIFKIAINTDLMNWLIVKKKDNHVLVILSH